ncbi:MAG: hypothetical protein IT281_11090 [Ignavibacteria bacterium]|nr:hypothetical protein [Ignavibacteria bacterium]
MIKDGINVMQQIRGVNEKKLKLKKEILNFLFCFLGSAFSRKVRVRLAELGAFPIYDKPQVIQVRRGDSLKIPCKPPTGVPDPETYWTDNTNTGDQFGFLVSNSRIQQDYYGLLNLF